jgi:hypothetical protein
MDEELHWTNCVVMDRSEADIHQQRVLVGRQDPSVVWGPETVDLVQARFSEEVQMSVLFANRFSFLSLLKQPFC